uniref:Uncharacterized protein n=1 Tax=Knipowitschia caucasica TaxID=637954 RepID=A0AAV2KQQ8_KNICA
MYTRAKTDAAKVGLTQPEGSPEPGAVSEQDANNANERLLIRMEVMMETMRTDIKCEDWEGRSRLNNIRVVGVPEGSEDSRPTVFVAKLLQGLLGLDVEPVLDRAHRTLRPKPKDGELPRPFVVRVNMFQQRCVILQKAGSSGPLFYKGKRVSIFPDFTTSVAKKRAAFAKVKKELHSCPGVKFGLFYPARLHITPPSGQTHKFEDLTLAMDFVLKRLKTVVIPESV